MTWTLLRKELRQHWLVFVLLVALTMAGYVIVLATNQAFGESGSIFNSLRIFVMVIVTLGSLALCNRLVVVEYAAKTQLFLEALPVARWRMVAVKYGLGLCLLLGIVAAALALACLLGQRSEALTPRFAGLLAMRALSAAVFAYHFFFLMGFLGRYRLALYIGVYVTCVAVAELTDLKLERFGPVALLDERFAFEREEVPWQALRETWLLSGVFVLLVFVLALTREGTVATLLAEKMSHREKVFIAALLIGIMAAVSVLQEKAARAPFDLHDAVTEPRKGLVTKVATGSSTEVDTRRLAVFVADELAAAQTYLSVTQLPPVFITRRSDLDASRFERGELENASGIHVQANFGSDDFRTNDFSAWLLREVWIAHSHGRVKLEPKFWVLDGFALFHGARERATAPLTADRALALRALYGTETGFKTDDLRRWNSFRERVGGEIAAAVAWSGLKTLARRHVTERCQRFLRSVLGENVPRDFRALLHERSAPLEELLSREAGVAFETFWAQWQEELAMARRELAPALAQLPRLRGEVKFIPLSTDSRLVRYELRLTGPLTSPRYSFLYHELPVYDEEVAPQAIRREQNPLAQQVQGELPESYSRGARLYWTFALDVPELGCPVISGWKREEIR